MNKKNGFFLVLVIGLMLLFSACKGGDGEGDDNSNQVSNGSSNTSSPNQEELDNAKATLEVHSDKIVFYPAMVGDVLVHLPNGNNEDVAVHKTHIVRVFFGNERIGFHSVDPTKGLELMWDPANPVLNITGVGIKTTGMMISFLVDDGRELAINTDPKWLIIQTFDDMIAEVTDNKLIGISASDNPVPPVPPILTRIAINTESREISIIPGIQDDKIFYLTDSNPTETIMDAEGNLMLGYRIAWNDINSWYPNAGVIASLALPQTVIANAANGLGSGAGMPYLVRPDGSFIPFNTGMCTVSVNGIDVTHTAIWEDGLIHY